jgi:hypothetical protein
LGLLCGRSEVFYFKKSVVVILVDYDVCCESRVARPYLWGISPPLPALSFFWGGWTAVFIGTPTFVIFATSFLFLICVEELESTSIV